MNLNEISILVVEDNPGDYFLIEEMLTEIPNFSNDLVHAGDIRQAKKFLSEKTFDVVLLDLSLPDSHGLESFSVLNEVNNRVPYIILSGLNDAEISIDAVKLGAQDYLLKGDFDAKFLQKVIHYSIERKNNLEMIQKSEEKYKYLFDKNPAPMLAYDMESLQIKMANSAAILLYGYSEKELMDMSILDIRPEEDVEPFLESLKSHSEDYDRIEKRHLKKDGSVFYVDVISHTIFLNGKKHRLVIANDITEKKRAEKEILFQANILKNVGESVVVTDMEGEIIYWNLGAEKMFGLKSEEMVGTVTNDLLFSYDDHNPSNKLTGKTIRFEEKVKLKDGRTIWVNARISPMKNMDDDIIGYLGVYQDITERRQAEETIKGLLGLSNKLYSSFELENLKDAMVMESTKLLNSELGFAGIIDDRGGQKMKLLKNGQWYPLDSQIIEKVMKTYSMKSGENFPFIFNNIDNGKEKIPDYLAKLGVKSMICTPITGNSGEAIGFLMICNKMDGPGFTEIDREKILGISQIASIAVQKAIGYKRIKETESMLKESHSELRALSRHIETLLEEERTRLGREIHDELGQVLTALKIDLSLLSQRAKKADDFLPSQVVVEETKGMMNVVDETINSVRRIIQELRPILIDELGLKAAIEFLAKELKKRTRINIKVVSNINEIAVDREKSNAIFRIVQESLTNVAKHSNANNVTLTMTDKGGKFVIELIDDGQGFNSKEIKSKNSFGLVGMRERALMIGGKIQIDSSPSKGTKVKLTFNTDLNQ